MTTSIATSTTISVLHVVEAYGGGVMVAVNDYIESTPQHRHAILAAKREGHDTGVRPNVPLFELDDKRRLRRVLAQVRRTIREFRPDVVHFHSSWAGVIGRLLPRGTAQFVYTPHCYAFERRDVPTAVRAAYRIVESVLARRLDAVIACSPREAQLARELRSGTPTFYVPNIAPPPAVPFPRRPSERLRIVASGRIAAQKGPDWFAGLARAVRARTEDVDISWLGGGEAAAEQSLRDAGVDVTGWLRRPELLAELTGADLYVHSAAWEGAPLSVLEAASLGVPVVARDIPALRSLGLTDLHADPQEAAEAVLAAWDADRLREKREAVRAIASRHTAAVQSEALASAYVGITGRTAVTGSAGLPPQPLPVAA